MNTADLEKLKFPIGKFEAPETITEAQRQAWIAEIESLPSKLRKATEGLSEAQLDTPYRPEGWTVRQVVHHVADSHMNCLMRFKLALTEEHPTIRPYEEAEIAKLPDYKMPVDVSLNMIEAIHKHWVVLLKNMTEADYARQFYHPGYKTHPSLNAALGMYAWHGNHHLAHILSTLK